MQSAPKGGGELGERGLRQPRCWLKVAGNRRPSPSSSETCQTSPPGPRGPRPRFPGWGG